MRADQDVLAEVCMKLDDLRDVVRDSLDIQGFESPPPTQVETKTETKTTLEDIQHVGGIGEAVDAMRYGQRVRRKGWNGKGMWLMMYHEGECLPMGLPFIAMRTVTGEMVPWLCSQTDLLALDWEQIGKVNYWQRFGKGD